MLYFEKIQSKDNPPVFSKIRLDINLPLSVCELSSYCVVFARNIICETFYLSRDYVCQMTVKWCVQLITLSH